MRATLLVAVSLTGGCSLLMQDRLPDRYDARAEPRCDLGDGPVVADLVLGVLGAAGTVFYAAEGGRSVAVIALDVVAVGMFLTSALVGDEALGRCEVARNAWDARNQRSSNADQARIERSRERTPANLHELVRCDGGLCELACADRPPQTEPGCEARAWNAPAAEVAVTCDAAVVAGVRGCCLERATIDDPKPALRFLVCTAKEGA